MMFEGTYRHYETNDQYIWVHGLFEKVWKEMEQTARCGNTELKKKLMEQVRFQNKNEVAKMAFAMYDKSINGEGSKNI